eukprot:TRINITY_DN3058_c0_g1_i1.p1 TRINITY_DN3058_c0_g1~~TRINITY_DN3058_c0_g1_i1.p1  ORF type:complete len:625 (-),score=235.36 TRINITY_DN3058_c0_g1_i1:159-1835(-)
MCIRDRSKTEPPSSASTSLSKSELSTSEPSSPLTLRSSDSRSSKSFFFFKQKTAYEISACLVGSEMCIRDRYQRRVHGKQWYQRRVHGGIGFDCSMKQGHTLIYLLAVLAVVNTGALATESLAQLTSKSMYTVDDVLKLLESLKRASVSSLESVEKSWEREETVLKDSIQKLEGTISDQMTICQDTDARYKRLQELVREAEETVERDEERIKDIRRRLEFLKGQRCEGDFLFLETLRSFRETLIALETAKKMVIGNQEETAGNATEVPEAASLGNTTEPAAGENPPAGGAAGGENPPAGDAANATQPGAEQPPADAQGNPNPNEQPQNATIPEAKSLGFTQILAPLKRILKPEQFALIQRLGIRQDGDFSEQKKPKGGAAAPAEPETPATQPPAEPTEVTPLPVPETPKVPADDPAAAQSVLDEIIEEVKKQIETLKQSVLQTAEDFIEFNILSEAEIKELEIEIEETQALLQKLYPEEAIAEFQGEECVRVQSEFEASLAQAQEEYNSAHDAFAERKSELKSELSLFDDIIRVYKNQVMAKRGSFEKGAEDYLSRRP